MHIRCVPHKYIIALNGKTAIKILSRIAMSASNRRQDAPKEQGKGLKCIVESYRFQKLSGRSYRNGSKHMNKSVTPAFKQAQERKTVLLLLCAGTVKYCSSQVSA